MKNISTFSLFLALCVPYAFAGELFYPSGVIRMYSSEGVTNQSHPKREALREFHRRYFSKLDPRFEWRQVRDYVDNTHHHFDYQIYLDGIKVYSNQLRLHYNLKGFIDFGTSAAKFPFRVENIRETKNRLNREAVLSSVKQRFKKAEVKTEPVYWVNDNGELIFAYDTWVFSARPFFTRNFILDGSTLEVLEEKRTYRFSHPSAGLRMDSSHDVYMVHPDRAGLSTQVLPNTDGLPVFSDGSNFHVRRMPLDTTFPFVDVAVGVDFTGVAGFDSTFHDGANYQAACTSTATNLCPNQAFDAINVYFHMRSFRTTMNNLLSTLGISPTFSLDPISVTVNMLAFDLDGDGDSTDEANNAFYTTGLTDVLGRTQRGLFFLRPANTSASSSICPSSTLLNLAREAMVVVHEYQHYLTDIITQMVPGSGNGNVGDVLHEGYSDYFAATQVNRLNGEPSPLVTEIGEFAFQNCEGLKRDIATLKVYQDSSSSNPQNDFSDIHVGGWTWASGLWQLRTDLGRDTADQLALKSMTFLSTEPGFLEAIEALIQADKVLNSGANVSRIRSLFYDTLKFTGSLNSALFRDQASGLFEMGFRSCLSVPLPVSRSATGIGAFLWLLLTFILGRWHWRKS